MAYTTTQYSGYPNNSSYGSYSGYSGSNHASTGNFIGRSGWDSYSGKFYDNQQREVKITIEGEVRKGAKVIVNYYVPQGEAIGYIIQNDGFSGTWSVQGTYSDENSTGKFYLTFDPQSGSIQGSRTPFTEVGCVGCGLVSQPWVMSPANRRGRECTSGYCCVM